MSIVEDFTAWAELHGINPKTAEEDYERTHREIARLQASQRHYDMFMFFNRRLIGSGMDIREHEPSPEVLKEIAHRPGRSRKRLLGERIAEWLNAPEQREARETSGFAQQERDGFINIDGRF